jgi:PAS domain S-box-containing protein
MDSIRDAVNQILGEQERRRDELSARAPNLMHREFISIFGAALFIGVVVALFTRERLRTVSNSYNAALEELEQRSHQVHESRQWFRTTLESIGDAVIACDTQGKVEFLNAVAIGMTGWTAEEALGRPLSEVFHIVHEETREPAENPVEKVRLSKKVVGLANHTMLISRQGKERLIDDSAAPILDDNSEMRGIVLVFHDVTEQRRTQAALFAGEKLAVAGRLAASIAHEIHNPLDSVTNVLFLLRDENDPAKRAEYLRTAEQELGRTMQISRTMLSLYRESKAPVSIDLKDLMEGVLLLLERRIAQQGIQVTTEFSADCIVEGFPAELRQVVANVMVNAIEAAGPQGRIHIRLVGAPAEEFRGAGALIEVADSGPGIQDAAAQRLFQPFFTTKGEQGTGLGLWVSMGIVQKHGGMIRLANCDGDGYQGACARIYLPRKALASGRRTAFSDQGSAIS